MSIFFYLFAFISNILFLIKVPQGYGFLQVFDLYFKIHKVFDQQFHKNIMIMMHFFEEHVYSMECTCLDLKISVKIEDNIKKILF